ncbi:unnamed protein product [Calypogeia fissa]
MATMLATSSVASMASTAAATALPTKVATSTPRSCFFSGSHSVQVDAGNAKVTCRKEGIHPKFFPSAEVFCNGEHVLSVGGTQEKYVVDVWSGNHPFYQGNKTTLLLDADRVDKFTQRYGSLGGLSTVPILDKGEIIFEKRKKSMKGKGGKK